MSERPKLVRRARLRYDERDRKFMIVYPERGLVLNASAAEVVKLCDGTRTAAEIVAKLVSATGESEAHIARDVAELLARLEERRLIE